MEENCEQEDEKVILQNGRPLVFHICSMIGMSGVLITFKFSLDEIFVYRADIGSFLG